jgi:RNA polymerase sigma factor (sigma-70 family)
MGRQDLRAGSATTSRHSQDRAVLKPGFTTTDATEARRKEHWSVEISGFDSVLAAAQEGSEWAWEILVRQLSPSLLRFFSVRGVPDPEALVGEVFVDLARNLNTFEGDEASFRSWVFVIAYRRMADEWRRLRRRPEETPMEIPPEPAHSAPSAEDEAIDLLSSAEAAQLLAVLTDVQRDVILLRVVAGLSLQETANAMGKRIGAIKALQRRAIATLQREFGS